MAAESSFDIVSKVDRQEVDNALNQAAKEVRQRFDFKNTDASIAWSGESIELEANSEERVKAVLDVFQSKLVKRGISLKSLDAGEPRLSAAMAGRTSWPSWTGGIFGAIFIGTAILMVPRLGAATVLALIVVGQMLGSLAFDHFGLLGVPQHPASLARLAGAAFLLLGVVLIRS